MPDNRFDAGTRYRRQGREYVIEGYLPDGSFQVKDLVTEEFTSKSEDELVDALFYKDLQVVGDGQNLPFLEGKLKKSRASDITLFEGEKEEPRKREAYRRERYVREVIRRCLTTFTPKSLNPIIEDVSKRINDPHPPYWTTLLRWFKDYVASGKDSRALVPAWNQRGNRDPKYSGTRLETFKDSDKDKAEVISKLVVKAVHAKFLREPPPTVVSVHEWLAAQIRRYNVNRIEEDQLPVPHVNSIHNYIATLDPYEVDVARHGKLFADSKWRSHQQGPRPTRPLERVQFDHTRMDLLVVDTKTRIPIGRPWFTSLIDVFTKVILGFHISFAKPSYESVMYCMLNAIRPKTYVRKKYPAIQNTWDVYGIPESLTVDNAKEFYSTSFKDACFQLGIDLHYAPRGAAWFKGSMERFYGTINTELLHEMPGTTFSNIFQKKDYDPKKHAVVSIDALIEMTHVYIIDDYNQSVHRGISDIPARRWCESIKEWPPNVPARKEDLEVLLGHVVERSIDSMGIEFHYLYYNSKELGMIRRQLGKGEKAVVKINVEDISVIYVYDKRDDRYLPVPAIDQEYTKGLTLWQHIVISNYRRKFPKLLEDPDGLANAKLLLQEIVERELSANRILAGSEKIARFMNWGMPNFAELMLKEEEDGAKARTPEAEPGEEGARPDAVEAPHLAGISDATKSAAGDAARSDGEFDGQAELDLGQFGEPGDSSHAASTDGGGKGKSRGRRWKAGKKSDTAKKLKGNSEKTEAEAEFVAVPVESDDDDAAEDEWGSDYDLPV